MQYICLFDATLSYYSAVISTLFFVVMISFYVTMFFCVNGKKEEKKEKMHLVPFPTGFSSGCVSFCFTQSSLVVTIWGFGQSSQFPGSKQQIRKEHLM